MEPEETKIKEVKYEVKFNQKINGYGLYACEMFIKDQIVFTLSGKIFDKPTRESIHVGNNIHVHDDNGMYMNHSFNPTTYINGFNVIAYCDIQPGDEITFNYNASEIDMACPFECDGKMVNGIIK